jgi:hypothetical protein
LPKKKEPIIVSSKVWETLLEIEALRIKERKLVKKFWRDLKEHSTQRIHRLVFEQAMASNSAFPSLKQKELDVWITENISIVIITLIEQGDITVVEEEPKKAIKWLNKQIQKIINKK